MSVKDFASLLVDAGFEDVLSVNVAKLSDERDFDVLLLATGRSPQHTFAGETLLHVSAAVMRVPVAFRIAYKALLRSFSAFLVLKTPACVPCILSRNLYMASSMVT